MSSFRYQPKLVKTTYNIMGEPRTPCEKCGAMKPAKYRLCWNCWGSQPSVLKDEPTAQSEDPNAGRN